MVELSALWPTEASLNRLSFMYCYYILCFWVVLELSSACIVVDLSWAEFACNWKEPNRPELIVVDLALAELFSNDLRFS